CTLFNGDGDYW
nr:immunoglobulin heavy chain junction region [Mus musculus]MBK4189132.1 immunoglobulin heavy chain junction region [Mus musculus]MBK4189133.1 immunoglobulin heavy chain junction region [Mus musculus]MBK4189134.1 immunoglobulin heavy chain junction region [Mus musculus]MBK4189135.1 immunoglobulin heavy chain junction region [Mus musculus]